MSTTIDKANVGRILIVMLTIVGTIALAGSCFYAAYNKDSGPWGFLGFLVFCVGMGMSYAFYE